MCCLIVRQDIACMSMSNVFVRVGHLTQMWAIDCFRLARLGALCDMIAPSAYAAWRM